MSLSHLYHNNLLRPQYESSVTPVAAGGQPRPRARTLGSAGGAAMAREVRARRQQQVVRIFIFSTKDLEDCVPISHQHIMFTTQHSVFSCESASRHF